MDGLESNKLIKGALLLTFAGLISKVLSAGYRIPLQNLTGDIGFYIYQQVYPILGMAMVLSLYGFPSAISKMVVDLSRSGNKLSLSFFYGPIFLILLTINVFLFLFLFFNADLFALWIGDNQLKYAYQYAAIIFLLVPFTSLLRGLFQGRMMMKPTAYSQVGEQFIRVGFIIITAYLIYINRLELYEIGRAASFASILGSFTAMLILVFCLFTLKSHPITFGRKQVIPWKYYIKTIFILGLAATLNHMVLLLFQLADAFTFVPGLSEYGMSIEKAMEEKGIFDRGQPLIQLGIVLGSSFALALIPTISKEKLQRDKDFYTYIRSAFLFSFYLAVGATVGLIAIFPESNILLYQDDKGTHVLRVLVLSIFFSSVAITATSILQGLGFVKRTAVFIGIAFFMKWILNRIFIAWIGAAGGAIATVISLVILFVLVLFELRRKVPGLSLLKQINWFALIKASLLMLLFIGFMEYLIPSEVVYSRIQLLGYVLFISIVGGGIYIIALLRGRAFTNNELTLLPLSSLFIRIQGRKERGKN